MKIAFVYDWINKFGGAERILLALHEIWPDAPIYTSVYNETKAKWAKKFKTETSFMQKIPYASDMHELFAFLTPFTFESFHFDQYDVVVSITSSDAKSIITKPRTLHVCYCLTPTRYLWSGYRDYLDEPGMGLLNPLIRQGMKLMFGTSRKWDYISSHRPDTYVAISKTVAKRIQSYYHQNCQIIYPPVDIDKFYPGTKDKIKQRFYLIVSRLVPYKKIDYIIDAFKTIEAQLIIIGSGIDEMRLKKIAEKNVHFVRSDLTDHKLCWYYQNCEALIFPGEEDFGLTVVEAQACGTPVIVYSKGGAKEGVVIGKTGELYNEADKADFLSVLKTFQRIKYRKNVCVKNAHFFSKQKFKQKFKQMINREWKSHFLNV
jgi:glycosyltransferase involved in cell wall biosynthesis